MDLPPPVLELFVAVLAAPLLTTLHEAGHALAARPAGYRVTSFGVGHGAPVARWHTPGGAVFYLGWGAWTGGMCVAVPRGARAARPWLYHLGGLLAQGVVALALWPLVDVPLVASVARLNLLVALVNALPWRVGSYESDGWQLLASARPQVAAGPPLAAVDRLVRVARQQERVGARFGVAWCTVVLAWVDRVVGRPAEALALVQQAGQDRVDPQLEPFAAWVTAEARLELGDAVGALRTVREARELVPDELEEHHADLLTLAEARAWVALGDPARARHRLASLAGVEGLASRGALVALLEADLGDPAAAEEAVESSARRLAARLHEALPDPVGAAVAVWAAADRLEGHRDVAGLRRAASRAASRLLRRVGVEDRQVLAMRLGPVVGVRRPRAADDRGG